MTDAIGPARSTGFRRLRKAFAYSIDGLAVAFQSQEAFRLEVILAILLVPVALVSDVSPAGRAVMIMSVLGVLGVELVNSAIEATVDRISLEPHTLSKLAKDLGSAAVLVSLLNLLLVWLVLLLPWFFRR